MEFETNTTPSGAEAFEHASAKRLTLNPVHAAVEPPYDPNKDRMHDRSGTSATFEFDTETTAASVAATSGANNEKTRFSKLLVAGMRVSAVIVFIAVLVILKTYY